MTVALGSPAWFDLLTGHMRRLVARDGVLGETFTFCEIWTDSPVETIGRDHDGRAGWNVRITGTTCDVETGEVDDVDLKFVMDYEAILPFARLRTSETLGRPPVTVVRGDPRALPAYFHELHDALTEMTA